MLSFLFSPGLIFGSSRFFQGTRKMATLNVEEGKMDKKRRRALISTTMLGFVCAFGVGGSLFADDMTSSSECINCHTDLEEMDRYGALSHGQRARIPGAARGWPRS